MEGLSAYFSNLSLFQVWQGNFDLLLKAGMPEKQLKYFRSICEVSPADTETIYKFLGNYNEPLFISLYGKKIAPELKRYNEDLLDHTDMVAENLINTDIGQELAIKFAVLSGIGKKYNYGTNNNIGAAALSAFVTGFWLRQKLDDILAREIVAIIYGHQFPLTTWCVEKAPDGTPVNHRREFYEDLLAFYDGDKRSYAIAMKTMKLIDILSECDRKAKQDQGLF